MAVIRDTVSASHGDTILMDHDDLGPGEIRRGFDRLEKQISGL